MESRQQNTDLQHYNWKTMSVNLPCSFVAVVSDLKATPDCRRNDIRPEN